jgi:hypothetical protein
VGKIEDDLRNMFYRFEIIQISVIARKKLFNKYIQNLVKLIRQQLSTAHLGTFFGVYVKET